MFYSLRKYYLKSFHTGSISITTKMATLNACSIAPASYMRQDALVTSVLTGSCSAYRRSGQRFILFKVTSGKGGPGSSVDIATGYGLNGPEIESRWGRDFLHLSRPALGPTQPPVQWVPGLSRG
jgi:hypothetical protein